MRELIAAHLEQHDDDSAHIAGRIQREFVDVVCETLPGSGIYVSLRGSPVAALQLRSEMAARFSQQVANVTASIPDLVTRSKATSRHDTKWQKLRRWGENHPVPLAGLIALAGLQVFNKTVWDVFAFARSLIVRALALL